MSLSPNNAQMRELSELRNHLKWLDEERRKSTRKMAELEQRLAQQGREVADRDQKITELERQIVNFNQRFEQMADSSSGTPETEQRLQDLEWHVSSMNAVLTKVPTPEVEQKRQQEFQANLQEEIARAVNATHERVESSQSLLEAQLRSEIAALRDSEDRQSLLSQLEMQASQLEIQASQLGHQTSRFEQLGSQLERQNSLLEQQAFRLEQQVEEINALKEANFELSGRLRETTESLAADSQSSINALAQSIQNHLDTALSESNARMDALADDYSARFEMLTADNSSRLDIITAEIQQRVNALNTELDEKLTDLPDRSVDLTPDITRLDEKLSEVFGLHEKWEARLGQLEQNIDKLGNVREILPVIDRIEQELELRQAEELRLSNLLSTQEERFSPLSAAVEDLSITNTTLNNRLIDTEKIIQELETRVRDINDNLRPTINDVDRRLSPLTEKMTALTNSAMKAEAGLQAISGDHIELREMIVNTTDELQQQQNEITRQLENWQVTMDENKDTIERFTQQWITLSNQYKEARMAVQNFAHWQKQLEQQKREASEMLRLESNRMQGRWDGFLLEVQEKLKNFEIDYAQKWQTFELENEQKWSAARRSEKLWREEITAVDELIQKLQQDNRNLIWRVQNAQADAIKKWPRLLMEEVEKAVEINPNRRLTSVTAPPSGEMSVVDAIEQGLITIDYNDDTDIDN